MLTKSKEDIFNDFLWILDDLLLANAVMTRWVYQTPENHFETPSKYTVLWYNGDGLLIDRTYHG